MKFQHVNNFSTDDPRRLADELSRLEDNIDRAMVADFLVADKVLSCFAFNRGDPPLNIVTVKPDQQLVLDTTGGDVYVMFPALTPANYGRRFVLLRPATGNSVITANVDVTVTCNGSTSWPVFTGATSRATVFYCDPTGYYQ